MTAAGVDDLSRALHPGAGCQRAPGNRGVPRGSVRRTDRTNPRDHPNLPPGVGPKGAGGPRRPLLPTAPLGGSGHRPGQAVEDHHQAAPSQHPHPRGRAGTKERVDDRRDRRRMVADPLSPRPGRRRLGRRLGGRGGKTLRRPGNAGRHRRGLLAIGEGAEAVRDFARPMVALYVGGMGARDKNFTTTCSSGTATRTPPQRFRTCTWMARSRRRALRCPTHSWPRRRWRATRGSYGNRFSAMRTQESPC